MNKFCETEDEEKEIIAMCHDAIMISIDLLLLNLLLNTSAVISFFSSATLFLNTSEKYFTKYGIIEMSNRFTQMDSESYIKNYYKDQYRDLVTGKKIL